MKKIFLLIFICAFFNGYLFAQTYNITTNNGQTISTCTGDFYDNASGNYSASVDQTITFQSSSATSTHIKVSFNQFDVNPTDTLYVYDGLNTSATLIGKFNNNNPLSAGQNIVQASIYNSSGALTFRFKTDASNQAAGWFASIVCTPACQKIVSSLDTVLTMPHPDSNYVDACMGDSITFAGNGIFPQNNILYNQQNSACTFQWDFGDGTTGTGQVIKHKYLLRRGYDIMLKITDSLGCVNTNAMGARVRMAGFPDIVIIPLADMCSNDSATLKVGYLNNSNIMVNPSQFIQISKQSFDSTMFLPDGPNCLPGIYNTSVVFNNFPQGLTITSASNILAICVTMEHSFTGDLGFTIFCPNGQNVVLDPNTHSGGAYFGEPYGGIDHGNWDNGCLPADNPHGVGWSYCWSEIYSNGGNTLDWLSSNACTNSLCGGSTGNTIDSTNQINHTNYIMPQNSLAGLIGCPLNGTWNIQIVDDYAIDNGYIFHWDLQLQANLMPVNWTYEVLIDSVGFYGPLVTALNDSIARVHPSTGGTFIIPISLFDDYGCKWDTNTNLTVVQMPTVNLGNDTSFCEGHSISLNAGNPGSTFQWNDFNNSTSQTIMTKDSVLSSGVSFIYDYVAHVTNQNANIQCTSSDSVRVTLNPVPGIEFEAFPITGCEPITVAFTNSTFPPSNYIWNFGDNSPTVTTDNPSHTYNSTGSPFTVTLVATTNQGCTSTYVADSLIKVFPQPHAEFTWTPTMGTTSNPVITFTDATTPANPSFTHDWDFGDNSTHDITTNPFHLYPIPNTYEVVMIVSGSQGCADTVRHSILIVNDSLIFPNIITPNGDGFNDNFVIKGLEDGAYPVNRFVVYNRWGKKVYDTDNYVNGEFDGKGLPDGVYYYIFTGKGVGLLQELKHQSSLEILR